MDSKNSSDWQIGLGLRLRQTFSSFIYFQIGQHVVLLHRLSNITLKAMLRETVRNCEKKNPEPVQIDEVVVNAAAKYMRGACGNSLDSYTEQNYEVSTKGL